MKLPSFLRTLEIFSLIFVACCVVFLVTYLGYKYSVAAPPGYCDVQQRYISDEEFIKASVDLFEWKHAQNKLRWEASPNLYTSEIKWSNEILDQNRKQPGFIKVWRGDTQTIFRWLTGWQQIEVTLNANSGDGQIRFFYDVCGTVIQSDYGYFQHSGVFITTTNYLKVIVEK